MAAAGRRSRCFVIVKRFMGDYNAPFPHGGLNVRPDTKLLRTKYKGARRGRGGRGHSLRFSSDRPINDVLLFLHFLTLYFFLPSFLPRSLFSSPPGRSFPLALVHRHDPGATKDTSGFAIKVAICLERDIRREPRSRGAITRRSHISTETPGGASES